MILMYAYHNICLIINLLCEFNMLYASPIFILRIRVITLIAIIAIKYLMYLIILYNMKVKKQFKETYLSLITIN